MKFEKALNKARRAIANGKSLKFYLYLDEDRKNIDRWIEIDDQFIYNTTEYTLEDFVTKDTWHTKKFRFPK